MSKNTPRQIHVTRLMESKDIEQVSAIEKDAFPDLFPPTSFTQELERKRSTFLVSLIHNQNDGWKTLPLLNPQVKGCENPNKALSNTYRRGYSGWRNGDDFLTGMLGFWEMVGECHIVTIGVRRNFRRRGIGELLLLDCLEICTQNLIRTVTLEVRASNGAAQALYSKYGFAVQGRRKSYYTDNLEDALIMTVTDITSSEYIERITPLRNNLQNLIGE